MITLIYAKKEAHVDAFKFGVNFADPDAQFRQSVDAKGYWLLIEDPTDGDNMTYFLDPIEGLIFDSVGVEV